LIRRENSTIKSAFDKAIGADLAKHYYIKGGIGERKRIDYYSLEH
jgi:hypothetical protein